MKRQFKAFVIGLLLAVGTFAIAQKMKVMPSDGSDPMPICRTHPKACL